MKEPYSRGWLEHKLKKAAGFQASVDTLWLTLSGVRDQRGETGKNYDSNGTETLIFYGSFNNEGLG
jgi:hypothetical protein